MTANRPSSCRWGREGRRSPSDSTPNTVKGGEVMKIKKLAILAVAATIAAFISLGGGRAWAADLFVDPAGNDANDCLSAATPCLTITAAIGKAAGGDTINVAAGTYAERLTINKSLDLSGAQFGVDPTPAGARTMGGFIGSQFGKGDGQLAATAAGTFLGAVIGSGAGC